jgi:endoglucanase
MRGDRQMNGERRMAAGGAWVAAGSLLGACITSVPEPSSGSKATPSGAAVGPALSECASGAIDDLEDGNSQIFTNEARGGYWYTYSDTVGSTVNPEDEFVPSPGGANGSAKAARIWGKTGDRKNVWAGMAFPFTNPKGPYDASKYKGISFWAKRGDKSTAFVYLRVPDVNTTPDGGVCKQCFNDFGANVELTQRWKKYVFSFDVLKQEPGWGEPHPHVVASKIYELQWQIKTRNVDFDVWIDDVRFVGCGG